MAFGRRALPRVVVYAYKTEDVVAAVKCAAAYGFSVSAAGACKHGRADGVRCSCTAEPASSWRRDARCCCTITQAGGTATRAGLC